MPNNVISEELSFIPVALLYFHCASDVTIWSNAWKQLWLSFNGFFFQLTTNEPCPQSLLSEVQKTFNVLHKNYLNNQNQHFNSSL